MDGIGGKQGWEWIFIIEGVLTVAVGIASFWLVQDFPDTAKFLTEKESRYQRQTVYLHHQTCVALDLTATRILGCVVVSIE